MKLVICAGGVNYISFSSPVFLGALSFPFIGAPTRSLFSASVDSTPELAGFEGTMQALLSVSLLLGFVLFSVLFSREFAIIFSVPKKTRCPRPLAALLHRV